MKSEQKPSAEPTVHLPLKPLLFGRLAFGAFILFALVGYAAGKDVGALFVTVITVIMWVVLRIILEALEAYLILMYMMGNGRQPKAPKSDEKDDGPTPPTAPA